jgi:hypothetical protein
MRFDWLASSIESDEQQVLCEVGARRRKSFPLLDRFLFRVERRETVGGLSVDELERQFPSKQSHASSIDMLVGNLVDSSNSGKHDVWIRPHSVMSWSAKRPRHGVPVQPGELYLGHMGFAKEPCDPSGLGERLTDRKAAKERIAGNALRGSVLAGRLIR